MGSDCKRIPLKQAGHYTAASGQEISQAAGPILPFEFTSLKI